MEGVGPMKWRRGTIAVLLLTILFVIAGCGGPKEDVSIFIMGDGGFPTDLSADLKPKLQAKLGEKPTVSVNVSPMFSPEKMIVELAAGENGIIVLPGSQIKALANQGAFQSLEDTFDKTKYPNGVMEITITEKEKETKKTGLYAIPMEQAKMFTDIGYTGKDLFAFIPVNAPNVEYAKQALKALVEG